MKIKFLLYSLLMLPTSTLADSIPVAVLSTDTLAFTYAEETAVDDNTTFRLNKGSMTPAWSSKARDVSVVVFDTKFAKARPTSTHCWFNNFTKLKTIEGIQNLNTANVTDMSCMFSWCGSIYKIDVSHFNTEKVTDMGQMFGGCTYLHDIEAGKFNTANVTRMTSMFSGCTTLSSLDLSSFDMSNVADARCMLQNCSSLSRLDMGGNSLNCIGQTDDAFKGVGKSSKPCALTISGNFDKSVLGTKTGSGQSAYYSWLGGCFAEPTVKTGIKSLSATANDSSPAYNLGGQRVGGNHKGLTVKHGRKFIRR